MTGGGDCRHRAAVLGDPVEHSLSPLLHTVGYRAAGLADWDYTRIRCPKGRLAATIAAAGPQFRGFSVTMPGKFEALEFASEATARARAVGSANTLVRLDAEDSAGNPGSPRTGDPGSPRTGATGSAQAGATGAAGRWRADNTDVDGVHGALDELAGPEGRAARLSRVVLLGAGGTARAALYALVERGVGQVDLVNRTDRSGELADLVADSATRLVHHRWDEDLRALSEAADAVVSTVPAGVADPYAEALGHAPVLDVVYDPRPTKLCTAAAANGYLTAAGHVMLACQAFGQFEQFTGRPAPRERMRAAVDAVV